MASTEPHLQAGCSHAATKAVGGPQAKEGLIFAKFDLRTSHPQPLVDGQRRHVEH